MPPKKKAKASTDKSSTATTRRAAASAPSTTPATTRSSTRAAAKRIAAATPEQSPPAVTATVTNGKRKRGSAEIVVEDESDDVIEVPAPRGNAKSKKKATSNASVKSTSKAVTKKTSSTRSKTSGKFNSVACENWFEDYADAKEHTIGAEKIAAWFDDLSISPESIVLYLVLWKCRAETTMEISKGEFLRGMQEIGVDCNENLLAKLPGLISSVQPSHDKPQFLAFYKWCFDHFKMQGSRYLTLDVASLLLKTLLDPEQYSLNGHASKRIGPEDPKLEGSVPGPFPHTYAFIEYLEEEARKGKEPVITKDQYEQFIPFNKDISWDLNEYDEDQSTWPTLFDNYIAWKKAKYPQTIENNPE